MVALAELEAEGACRAGGDDATPPDTLALALGYVRAGLSVIPIARDGSKAPNWQSLPQEWDEKQARYRHVWTPFQGRLPTKAELYAWFKRPDPPGVAIVGGGVSGNQETLDFDARAQENFPCWRELVEAECPGLVARLSVQRTPKPGYHARYRVRDFAVPGNLKLAEDPALPRDKRVLIETRGEGGYALAPGCPAACHETGRLYEHDSGPRLTEIPTISAEEREVLIRCARAFDLAPPEQKVERREAQPAAEGAPGTDYNARGPDWEELLTPVGWALAGRVGDKRLWRRPGKDRGWSATTGHCKGEDGTDWLYVFTSNAPPLEPKRCYSKFAVFALLHQNGDFGAAAKALAGLGYGSQGQKSNGQAAQRSNVPPVTAAAPAEAFCLDLIDSATFDKAKYELEWEIENVLVARQPCILAGPKKSLKTMIGVEVGVSLGTRQRFLGTFWVPRQRRVLMLSGESGQAVLQSAAREVAASKGKSLPECDILWGFRLPQLSNAQHLDVLRRALEKHRVNVLLFDPLYLAMLAGEGAQNYSAANLYHMGPLLLAVSRACLDVGCTPVLFHHFKLTRADPYAEPQLEDLAYAGVQEFARQWILLGRRSPFDPEDPDGKHELWLSAGGSAGHSLVRAVDVYEGKIDHHFKGRTWKVEVMTPNDARAAKSDAKQEEKRQRKAHMDRDDETAVLLALDELDPDKAGVIFTHIRKKTKLNNDRARDACERLADADILGRVQVGFKGGKGATKTADGYRRLPHPDADGISGISGSPADLAS
jgi:hypothetical protein